jgi:transposase
MTALAELTRMIDSCYTIFVREISEPQENVLRLVLQEADVSSETVSHKNRWHGHREPASDRADRAQPYVRVDVEEVYRLQRHE